MNKRTFRSHVQQAATRPSSRKSAGFTLIELLVAMAMSIFLIGGILLMQQSARTASGEAERLSRVQESMRFSSDYIVREMRNAGFRDQLSLTINEFDRIGEEFAWIENNRLSLLFSGIGSCAEPFSRESEIVDVARIIENTYFVEDGEFRCTGIILDDLNGATVSERTVTLVSGVRAASFQFICPADVPNCSCSLWQHGDDFSDERRILNETCQGIRIGLEVEGPSESDETIALEMSAGFRNVILGRMMWQGVDNI